jgi:hypothetical protein
MLEFLISWPERKAFLVRKHLACAIENIFEMEGNVVPMEGVQDKETWPKNIAIMRVKAVPKLDVTVRFCEVAGANEGVAVVLKRPVVLKNILFTIHAHSRGIFDEIA